MVAQGRKTLFDSLDAEGKQLYLNRLRRSPTKATLAVAIFTALNGLFVANNHNMTILAGLSLPYFFSGYENHLLSAFSFAVITMLYKSMPKIILVPLIIYVIDALVLAYHGVWSGVIMHVLILLYAAWAQWVAHVLGNKLSQEEPINGATADAGESST
jgi:hypothetical protein